MAIAFRDVFLVCSRSKEWLWTLYNLPFEAGKGNNSTCFLDNSTCFLSIDVNVWTMRNKIMSKVKRMAWAWHRGRESASLLVWTENEFAVSCAPWPPFWTSSTVQVPFSLLWVEVRFKSWIWNIQLGFGSQFVCFLCLGAPKQPNGNKRRGKFHSCLLLLGFFLVECGICLNVISIWCCRKCVYDFGWFLWFQWWLHFYFSFSLIVPFLSDR